MGFLTDSRFWGNFAAGGGILAAMRAVRACSSVSFKQVRLLCCQDGNQCMGLGAGMSLTQVYAPPSPCACAGEQCKSDWDKRDGVFLNGVNRPINNQWLTYSDGGSVIKVYALTVTVADTPLEVCFKSAKVACPTMAQFFTPTPGPAPQFPLQYSLMNENDPVCCPIYYPPVLLPQ
eukprot:150497-Chlamydomonas_euryale.AAC.1